MTIYTSYAMIVSEKDTIKEVRKMNMRKLFGVMREHGDTQETLAAALGIARVTLNKKIHGRNGSSFNQPEIAIIRARYALSADDVEANFFSE